MDMLGQRPEQCLGRAERGLVPDESRPLHLHIRRPQTLRGAAEVQRVSDLQGVEPVRSGTPTVNDPVKRSRSAVNPAGV